MENTNTIKLKFDAENTIELNSDTPDFSKLIDYIKIHSENFDETTLNIECDDNNFDSEVLKETLISTINDLNEKFKLNKQKFDEKMNKLKKD